MATVPDRDPEDARGEMDRLFAEMPGAPAALVLLVAARGKLGYAGSSERRVAHDRWDDGGPGAPGTPHNPRRLSGPTTRSQAGRI